MGKKLKTSLNNHYAPAAKPQETLPSEIVREIQQMELEEDPNYQENEQFIRSIYKNQSIPQLELVNRLLASIVSARSKKSGPALFVGLYPSGKHLKVREETRIKEQLLMEFKKKGYIKSLDTRIVEIPDEEGPFTTDVIIANLQYSYLGLKKALEITKAGLEQKIRIRTGGKIRFENQYLKYGGTSKPFKGGQGKILELLLLNRQEYFGTQIVVEGQTMSIKDLKKAGNYLKGDFRSAIRQCRAKLRGFQREGLKIEIKNNFPGKGLYQLVIHYPR